MNNEVYILAGSRTPMGAYGGSLSGIPATKLGAIAIEDVVAKSGIQKTDVQAIVMGNVLSANLGQAPARQASMAAGLPDSVCATTVNKVCASGMKAISILYNDLLLGNCDVGIAGGMENMSAVPHYLPNARFGIGYGNNTIVDGLAKDGLTDVYNQTSMGVSADLTAKTFAISRGALDDYAEQSYRKAAEAWATGLFANEVAVVEVSSKKGPATQVSEDETFKKANFEKMRLLKPAFSPDGTATAANASPMNDGASALVLATAAFAESHQLKPRARIVAYAEAEQEPMFFTTTPVLATQKVLAKAGLTLDDIDFFEVNEAFAVVALAYMQALNVKPEKLNIFGGAVALGHPLGSSGSRIVITLLNVLKTKGAKYGLAAICNGGGGASAIIIENLS